MDFKEEWLFLGAVVPVDAETTQALVKQIHRLIRLVGSIKLEQAMQEPVAWMTFTEDGDEDDIHYENPEGRLLEGWTYKPLYTHPQQAEKQTEKQEPLGYWNAVEGWVELPEDTQKPTAWVYPEGLDAFQQRQPWTAYGTDGEGRIPLYTSPRTQKPWVGLTPEDYDSMRPRVPYIVNDFTFADVAAIVEAKLKEKNK
jgi:hypothetical protein